MMYKNWLQIKKQEEKERVERKKEIDDIMSKWTVEDWNKFRAAEFDIVVEPNKEAEERMIEEERKVDSIIDGTFWTNENLDFEELNDEACGKRGKEILVQIKPYYRKDLVKTYEVEHLLIFIKKEIRTDFTVDESKYRIESERWSNEETGPVIDCDNDNIWYKEKWERIRANIEKARERELLKHHVPSIASYHSEAYTSLRELYEEKIEQGLNHHQLKKMAYSKDLLDQLFFLYTIKRAQRQDEIAAELLYKMYENVAAITAAKWIKSIELKRGIKFKAGSELDIVDIQITAKYFLKLLITGDDPAALFEYIKQLDDPRNIELIFTRKLGKKIKDLTKYMRGYLGKEVEELKNFQQVEKFIELSMNNEYTKFDQEKVKIFIEKIMAARENAKNPKKRSRTTYREFIKIDKLNEQIKKLITIYYEKEDRLISYKHKGFPSLDDENFDAFSKDEKDEFERIKKDAESKAYQSEYNDWHAYQIYIDEDELSEDEKIMYEIYKKYDTLMNTEYYPSIGAKRLGIQAMSNPLSWFSAIKWFNDKIYDAKKNNNFTKWLLGGEGNPGALIELMSNWLYSSNYLKDTKRRIFKDEFVEVINTQNLTDTDQSQSKYISKKKLKAIESDEEDNIEEDYYTIDKEIEENNEPIERKLNEYKKELKIKDKHVQILRACLEKKFKDPNITYEQIGTEFKLSRRQIIRIWKKFESWLMPK